MIDVDHRDRAQRTPLHYAAVDKEAGLVQELLAAGAEVDARDYKEWTPLHMAAQKYTNLEVVKLLVAAGADVNAVNDEGDAALYIATASPGVRVILFVFSLLTELTLIWKTNTAGHLLRR